MSEIRSYRRVFDLERRIYSVQELRLNPGGVPVRGVVYFLAIVGACVFAATLPLAGTLVSDAPWYLRDIAFPGAAATVLGAIRIEGRTFHVAMHAIVRFRLEPRTLAGARRCEPAGTSWHPPEMLLIPDGSDGDLRGLRYTGPGAVLIAVEHDRGGRAKERGACGVARPGIRPAVVLTQPDGARLLERGQVISLGRRARLRVRSGRRRSG